MLLSLSIAQATDDELRNMALARGLAFESADSMREMLYSLYHIEPLAIQETPSAKKTYTLTILHADLVTSAGANSSLVELNGNALVQFSLQDDERVRKLSADRMIIDLDNTLLSAFGSVNFDDSEDKGSVQTITGSIVTLNWTDQSLLVRGGSTTTERKNSEDEEVRFFTSGELITYNGSGDGIFFDKGFITTNEKHAYSSITADRLAFLSGGDLLVTNAYLSIGRVPVFWVPAFFFPGVRMVGNPAIGFTSDRGMFLNTTFEIYGRYPKFKKGETSSFSSLLSGESDASFVPDGPVYGEQRGEPTPFVRWTESSGSYLVLLADSYESSGISIGLEAHHAFFAKKVLLDTEMHLAVHPQGKEILSSYASFPKVRYYGTNALTVDTSWADLQVSLPFYSDPTVKRLYANRLSTFAIDSLFGKKQEFPSDYLSDIGSFTWKANGSFDFPTKVFGELVQSAKITTLNALIDWRWEQQDSLYSYVVQKVTLPELQGLISGQIFSWTQPIASKATSGETKAIPTGTFALDDTLAKAMVPTPTTKTKTQASAMNRSISLGYSVEEKLLYSANNLDEDSNWDNSRYFYTYTKPSLTLYVVAHPSYFTLKQTFTSPFISSEDQTKDIYLTRQVQLTSSTIATVPALGLTYTLDEKLYSWRDSFSRIGGRTWEEKSFAFTKEFVTRHEVKVAKSFMVGEGTLSPSVTATLYPLVQSLLPSLGYGIGPWAFSSSLKILQQDEGLQPELLSSSASFTLPTVAFSLLGTYDLSLEEADSWKPFALSGSGRLSLFANQVSLRESFSFMAYSTLYGENYFKDVTTTLSLPYLSSTLVHAGSIGSLEAQSLTTQVAIQDLSYSWWKRRIQLKLGLDARLAINFIDPYATALNLTAKVGFSIAEFLDLSFSLTSSNRGFHRYYSAGAFSFPLMWEDLLRSFDLVGDGRSSTQFNMNSISLELVHYMEDWSLNCKYTGSVVLSNNQYTWVPVVSVFLQWKTIPELKVEENWTESDGIWYSRPSS